MNCEINKMLYANQLVYLDKEWHTLWFLGKLVIRNCKTSLLYYNLALSKICNNCSTSSIFEITSFWLILQSFECGIVQISRSVIPKTCPTPLKISFIFPKCVKYISCAVFIIIARGQWTLWPTSLVATGWRRTFRIRPSSWCLTLEILPRCWNLRFRYSVLWCGSWFR